MKPAPWRVRGSVRTPLDPYAKEARRQYRLMARSLEIDGLLAHTQNRALLERYLRFWAERLRYLAATEGTEVPQR